MQLTEHFSLEELFASDTATRLGIDNTPPESVIDNLLKTATLAEAIRAALTEEAMRTVFIVVTSGYRCEALERVLTKSDFAEWCRKRDIQTDDVAWRMYFRDKAHPKGNGLDFKAPHFGTPYQIVQFIASRQDIMAQIDKIIMEGDWVHVCWSDKPRHEVWTASFDKTGRPTHTKGLA